jgi:hypothetical protein
VMCADRSARRSLRSRERTLCALVGGTCLSVATNSGWLCLACQHPHVLQAACGLQRGGVVRSEYALAR